MSGVTLEELLEEKGVHPSQLDRVCTDEHLLEIALFLESWRTVARYLGLSKVEVEDVERDGKEEAHKRLKILEAWMAKLTFKAKYALLVKQLLKIGRADQAAKVCNLLVSPDSKEGTQLCMQCDWHSIAIMMRFIIKGRE